MTRHHIEPPLIDDLHVCVSYACRHTSKTYLDPDEWNAVVLKMTPQDRDSPWLERRRIENTIGLLERIVGPKVGTQHNRARNRCGPSGTRQLDCIAEAVNTTIYLTLLEDNNLIRHHRVAKPERRGPLSGTWWHYAAAIIEIESDKLFAVDSWFYDNGHPATIISMEQWRQGGTPQ